MEWIAYCVMGGAVGILAGLLGVGGGLFVVPFLGIMFPRLGFPVETMQHLAVGTSLACIVFTSISSTRAHHGHGGVHWPSVKRIAPGIVIGTVSGSWITARMSTLSLKWIFVGFLFLVATQMLLKTKEHIGEIHNKGLLFPVTGGVIGFLSSMVGVGGGTMLVPLLLWQGLPMRSAVGTSAAIGFFIALTGTIGSIVNGLGVPLLPKYALGFVYLPAMAGIAVFSMMTAPIGARLAHRLPVPALRRVFVILLYIIAIKLLLGLV